MFFPLAYWQYQHSQNRKEVFFQTTWQSVSCFKMQGSVLSFLQLQVLKWKENLYFGIIFLTSCLLDQWENLHGVKWFWFTQGDELLLVSIKKSMVDPFCNLGTELVRKGVYNHSHLCGKGPWDVQRCIPEVSDE